MGESIIIKYIKQFVKGVITCFSAGYLHRLNPTDIRCLLMVAKQHGFPGMLGSIDCLHWESKKLSSCIA